MKIRYGMKSGQRQYVEGDESVELFEKLKADDQCLFAELISDDSRIVKRFTDETRKNETRNISEFNPVDGFKCEKCGIDLRDWSRIVFDEDDDYAEFVREYEFKFCPNCGKRVVE